LAKIAVELEHALRRRALNGSAGCIARRRLARGEGWTVSDVLCTCGPQDRPFEEQHSGYSIAVVVSGTFQYQGAINSGSARELMTPGSLLLGNTGQAFQCGHEHGQGDRCVSFGYSRDYFEHLAADAGLKGQLAFRVLRLPPLRSLSAAVASVQAGLASSDFDWEELSLRIAGQALQLANRLPQHHRAGDLAAEARVTRVVRRIENGAADRLTISSLAREAKLSPYHFLRIFGRITGLTPHQYLLRARLRGAALRLVSTQQKVLDIALDSGFGDVSNFNRAFRVEFGMSPLKYRNPA